MRPFAKELNKQKLKLYTKGKIGVIIDGTAHKIDKIKNKKKELEKLGYDTYMVFVNTTLERSKRNDLEKEPFLLILLHRVGKNVQKNMKTLKSLFKSNFQMVDNSDHLTPKEQTEV